MVATRTRGRRALTLIEILIALIILMVGLVGIFALFPVGIKSTQESVEDSTAALIAESFHHALIAGMRQSPPAQSNTDQVNVVFCHDGLSGRRWDGGTNHNATTGQAGGATLPDNTYVFRLPSETDGGTANNLMTFPVPTTGSPNPTTPRNALFRMGECNLAPYQYLKRCLMGTTGTNRQNANLGSVWSEDGSEALDQYFVAFDVTRVQAAGPTPYAQPLFEFRIGVYRNYQDRGGQGWSINTNPPGGAPWPNPTPTNPNGHPDLKKVFRTLIAGN